MTERPRYDGLGIAMLGLVALMLTGIAAAGFIRTPPAVDDTSVQTSMAWSSWAMVIVSIAGGVIGALSLYLIFRTLQAAQRSAVAAEQTATITREIGMAQARAYVSLENAKLVTDGPGAYFNIVLLLRNAGQSPTQHIRIHTTVSVLEMRSHPEDGEVTEDVLATFEKQTDFHDIAANQTAESSHTFFTLGQEFTLAKALAEVLYPIVRVTSEVHYQDVFAEEFVVRSKFQRAFSSSDDLKSGQDLRRSHTN